MSEQSEHNVYLGHRHCTCTDKPISLHAMHFFHRDKVPDPEITFNWNSPTDGTFHPGSPISGTVKLTSPVPRHIDYAEIIFYGRAMTHATRYENHGNNRQETHYYSDQVDLFRFNAPAIRDMWVEERREYTREFNFQFPQVVQSRGPDPYHGETAGSGIYVNETHPLPPSFTQGSEYDNYARVEYGLQTMVQFQGAEEPFVTAMQSRLMFAPYGQVGHPPELVEFVKETKEYSSSRLIGEQKSFGHSLRDKLSSHTPSVNIVMKSSIATLLSVGDSFPIYACVEIDSASSTEINIPTVRLQVKKIELCQFSFYRAMRYRSTGVGYSQYGDEVESNQEDTVKLNTVPDGRDAERQYGKSDSKNFWFYPATFEARIPGSTCPSFRTFNINHNFCIELTLEAEVCGKELEFKIDVPDVRVLPQNTRN